MPLNPPQNPFITAALYGLYMSVSSNIRCASVHRLFAASVHAHAVGLVISALDVQMHNACLRYQLVAGVIEERGIEEYIADRRICNVLSFIVRTSNTFVGSLLWLDFIRFFGLQSSGH